MPDENKGLRILGVDSHTVFQLSPILPLANQRIQLTAGAPPNTRSVTYRLNGQILGTVNQEPWALWWPLQLGSQELAAEAVLNDGSRLSSPIIPFRVVPYAPPEARDGAAAP
jgi:hypothetical protein